MWDILDMFRVIKFSVRDLGHLVRTGRWDEQGKFLEEKRGNSHSEMLPTYRSMLAEFKPTWRKAMSRGGRRHLSAEEIRSVLLAAPGARLEK